METEERYSLSVPQVAQRFNMTNHAVYRWIREGVIRAVKIGPNGDWRISERDLDEALVTNR